MGISFGSINTGLPKDIVKQIIDAEKIPIQQMEERKEKIESKKALVEELTKLVEKIRGDLLESKNARSFRELSVNNDFDHLNLTVDKNLAEPGTHQLEVLELARNSTAISNGVEDKNNTYLGVGYIEYRLPNGENKSIYVDSENSSLTGIAKLINGDQESGLTANVVNDGSGSDTPWKLLVSVEGTGDEKLAEFPYLYFVDGEVDLYLEKEREAQDAKVKLNGFELEVPSNRVTDLIPGVTIDLKKAKPGEEITIDVKEDTAKIAEKMTVLIESINAVLKFIKEQNTLDEKSDTSRTLGGDITLQTIESRIRSTVFKGIKTDYGSFRMSDIGVNFQRDGLLKLDEKKFESELNQNYRKVAQIVTGKYTEDGKTKGFMDYLDGAVTGLLQNPAGTLPNRKRGLQSNISQMDRRIDDRMRLIERKEQALKQKFARLEETISRMRSQGNGLAGLSGGAPDPIQQLG